MRLDNANRAFVLILGLAVLIGGYVICGAVAGVLIPIIETHIRHHGISALWTLSVIPSALALTAITIITGRALLTALRLAIASRRLSAHIGRRTLPAPARLDRAVDVADLHGRVVLVRDPEAFSLVHGSLRPTVVISDTLLERISDNELRAVLEHERYHVTNLDPLKSVVLAILSTALPISRLTARYDEQRELAADRQALGACERRHLAGALLHSVSGPAWLEPGLAPALAAQPLLTSRLTQMEGGTNPDQQWLPRTALTSVTLISAVTAILLIVACAGGLNDAAPNALVQGLLCALLFTAIAAAAVTAAHLIGHQPPLQKPRRLTHST